MNRKFAVLRYRLLSETQVVSFKPEEVFRLTKPEMGDCDRKR